MATSGVIVRLLVPVVSGGWLGRRATIAHEILDIEKELRAVKPANYALIDSIIEEAKQNIPAPAGGFTGANRETALRALTSIDGILVNRRFIYVLVTYLSDGLTPRTLSDADFESARDDFHNIRRIPMMDANRHKPVLIADCNIASFLYLAIGEALNMPISLVEVPGHNFVRWTFPDGAYLKFETRVEMSDAEYRQSYSIPNDVIKPDLMMNALSRDDVMGYVRYLRGRGWDEKGDYAKARRDYLDSVHLRPATPEARDYLALSYATCPSPSCRDAKQALALAQEDIAIWRRALYLDTLACAYAANGDFSAALREAKEVAAFSDEFSGGFKAIRSGQLCSPVTAVVFAFFVKPAAVSKLSPRQIIGNR
jgi:tetratricopeptide (TPR) repeat protein